MGEYDLAQAAAITLHHETRIETEARVRGEGRQIEVAVIRGERHRLQSVREPRTIAEVLLEHRHEIAAKQHLLASAGVVGQACGKGDVMARSWRELPTC